MIERWARRLDANLYFSGHELREVDSGLLGSLFDEVVAMFDSSNRRRISRCHAGAVFSELAAFPENVSLCIEVFRAGAQVFGACVVENAGPSAAWGAPARNRQLNAIDTVFHIFVHREIEALCESSLHRDADNDPYVEDSAPSLPARVPENFRIWYSRN